MKLSSGILLMQRNEGSLEEKKKVSFADLEHSSVTKR